MGRTWKASGRGPGGVLQPMRQKIALSGGLSPVDHLDAMKKRFSRATVVTEDSEVTCVARKAAEVITPTEVFSPDTLRGARCGREASQMSRGQCLTLLHSGWSWALGVPSLAGRTRRLHASQRPRRVWLAPGSSPSQLVAVSVSLSCAFLSHKWGCS